MKKRLWASSVNKTHFFKLNPNKDWDELYHEHLINRYKFNTYGVNSLILHNDDKGLNAELTDGKAILALEPIENLDLIPSIFEGKWINSDISDNKRKITFLNANI